MESQYLFHGKRLEDGKWIIGDLSYAPNGIYVFPQKTTFIGSPEQYQVDLASVGQSIWLQAVKSYRGDSEQDKTIFVNDIVKDLYSGCVYRVVYHAPSFVLRSPMQYCIKVWYPDDYEIIGNFNDDPSLFEII